MIRGSDPGRGNYSPLPDFQTSSEIHQSSYLMGNGAISSWVKRPGHEANYSLLSNGALKMSGVLPSFPLICLHVECREHFTFTLHLNCKKSLYQLITLTSLLINLLGRYAKVVDHLAFVNVAQGAPLGGGSTLHPIEPYRNPSRPLLHVM